MSVKKELFELNDILVLTKIRTFVTAVTIMVALSSLLMTHAQAAPQRSQYNPNAMDRMQFGKGGPFYIEGYIDSLGATKAADRACMPPQFPNSKHAPQGQQIENQGQAIDRTKLKKFKVALAGTANNSGTVCKEGEAAIVDAATYLNENPEDDGDINTGKGRCLKPCTITMQPNGIAQAVVLESLEHTCSRLPARIGIASQAIAETTTNNVLQKLKSSSGTNMRNTEAAMCGMAELASEAMADEFNPTWWQMLQLSATPLINVGNTSSGSQCKASKPVKTHSNAVYIVQQAYTHIYLPIAVLLLLPGAVATQLKSMLQSGILGSNDDDAVSPFTGILRVLIAIFLIPASQLIVSYSIDVGNSLQYEISRHINYANIYSYADEQVFRAPEDSFPGKILPANVLESLGKLQGTPEKLAKRFNMSKGSIMLHMVANSMCSAAAFGLVILCSFQLIMACYLLLMGPVAAALYAWPSGAGSLFSRVFSGWVDGVFNLCLWRFWWCVVLLVMDTRLGCLAGSGLLDICSLWELLMFISFLAILSYVPFNPFDFKPGDMVQKIMDKADEAVQETSNKKS